MDESLQSSLWPQFGAAIDMLENAVTACPESEWGDRSEQPEFWYLVFHTLFWLDFYLADSSDDFAPPAPFGLEEMDPAGVMPERVYTQAELLGYLGHCRTKSRAVIAAIATGRGPAPRRFPWGEMGGLETLLYNLRHVHHHVGQLQLILRRRIGSAPRWVARGGIPHA